MYYQPELETMPREELDALQLERLQKLVAYVYERIPFYRESFDEAGVKPEDIKSLDDLRKFPFTVKQDLRGTTKRGRSHSLLFGHNRHGNRGWLH